MEFKDPRVSDEKKQFVKSGYKKSYDARKFAPHHRHAAIGVLVNPKRYASRFETRAFHNFQRASVNLTKGFYSP
jgi:hypothetical protein